MEAADRRIVKALLQVGASWEQTNEAGWSALAWAREQGLHNVLDAFEPFLQVQEREQEASEYEQSPAQAAAEADLYDTFLDDFDPDDQEVASGFIPHPRAVYGDSNDQEDGENHLASPQPGDDAAGDDPEGDERPPVWW